MLGGMFILIWSATVTRSWWNNDAKLAITFTIVAFLIGCLFVAEQVTLYSFRGRDDSEETSDMDDNDDADSESNSSSALLLGGGKKRTNGKGRGR